MRVMIVQGSTGTQAAPATPDMQASPKTAPKATAAREGPAVGSNGKTPTAPKAPAPPADLSTTTGDNPFDPVVMGHMQAAAENVSYMFFVTVAVIIVGLPIARALGRRIGNPPPPKPLPSEDLAPKLRQLQESVDAMAIELERISENQRFTTKLLAERPGAPVLAEALLEPPRQG
jgi:hypothetical protein